MARAKSAMTSFAWFLPVLVFLAVCAAVPNSVWADYTYGGSINPTTDPTTWTSTTGVTVNGTVTVTNTPHGPTQINSANLTIGSIASKSGSKVTVNGTGSSWTTPSNGYLTICGNSATNSSSSMTISNGGTLTVGSITLGSAANSVATLTVSGTQGGVPSLLNVIGGGTGIILGSGGGSTGNLNILGGAIANDNAYVQIGSLPSSPTSGANGNVTVDGVGSQLNTFGANGAINIGANSASYYGNLTITNGAVVSASSTVKIGGSSNYSSGNIYMGNGGALNTLGLQCYPYQIVSLSGPGSGTITTRGMVADTSITFDATHGPRQTLSGFDPNILVVLDMTNSNNVGDLGVGYASTGGMLTIKDGVKVYCRNGIFGQQNGSSGSGTVSGAYTKWLITGNLTVGGSGTGVLSIINGGLVSASGGCTVSGTGSSAITVNGGTLHSGSYLTVSGASATGAPYLTIGNSGTVVSASDVTIGSGSGNAGTITVGSGAGNATLSTGGNLYVGSTSGTGSLAINAGGVVNATSGNTYVGPGTITLNGGGILNTRTLDAAAAQLAGNGTINATGIVTDGVLVLSPSLNFGGVTVNLNMSNPATRGDLGVGNLGAGSLTISNGAIAASNNGLLGVNAGATGNGTVSGASWTMNHALNVGSQGTGNLLVTSAGTVSDNNGYIALSTGGTGTATVNGAGSLWTNSNTLYVGGTGTSGQATLNITNGGTVHAGSSEIGVANGLTGTVTVNGSGGPSAFTTSGSLQIGGVSGGFGGTGSASGAQLNINSGGSVSAGATTYVGYVKNTGTGSAVNTGSLNFGGVGGGVLTTKSLYASLGTAPQVTGSGTVTTNGLVSDLSLSFASPGDLVQTFNPSAGTYVKLDLSTPANNGDLGIGYANNSSPVTLAISTPVSSRNGYLGYNNSSTGTATVTTGGVWTLSGGLTVGNSQFASGSLTVNGGGTVSNAGNSVIAVSGGAAASGTLTQPSTVTVDGAGSTWATGGNLQVGQGAGANVNNPGPNATLTISNGGNVTVGGAVTFANVPIGNTVTYAPVGNVVFGTGGGTLTANTLYTATDSFSGTGTVNTQGLVFDGSINFNGSSTGTLSEGNVLITATPNSGVILGAGYRSTVYGATTGGGTGTLLINNGAQISSSAGYVGNGNTGAIGLATVDGAGTSWTVGTLSVGSGGNASTLTISNGGVVNATTSTTVDPTATGGGYISFGPGGGTLTTGFLSTPNSRLSGSGNAYIVTSGIAIDAPLSFTSITGANETLNFGGVNVELNFSNPASRGALQCGYGIVGSGSTLGISGTTVYSSTGTVAYGTATVSGSGTWNANTLAVNGSTLLNINTGGTVTSSGTATNGGTVTVDGSGSTWNAAYMLLSAGGGGSTLTLTNGGTIAGNTITSGGTPSVFLNNGVLKATASNPTWIANGTGSTFPGGLNVQEGGVTINTNSFNVGISVPLTHGGANVVDGGVTKIGAGTLTLSNLAGSLQTPVSLYPADNIYSGLTTIKQGAVEFKDANAASPVLSSSVGAGANILAGKAVFDYGTASDDNSPDPASTIQSLLAYSYDGGKWDRGQFRTNPAGGSITLGWLDNGNVSYGTGADNVTVMATLPGDFNLDGVVNVTDLVFVAEGVFWAGRHAVMTGSSWAVGFDDDTLAG